MSRAPVSETRRLMTGREHEIVAALGIAMPRRGHIKCPTPHHADRNPSFRIDLTRGVYHCTCGGGDLLDLVQAMGQAHDALSAARWVRDVLGLPPIGQRKPETPSERAARERRLAELLAKAEEVRKQREAEHAEEVKRQRAKAFRMWMRRQAPGGTVVETYLRARGIVCPIPSTIGFLPPVKPSHHPAMISAFGLPDEPEPGKMQLPPARLRGVHLTLLKPDGSGKANVELPKLTIGLDHDMPIVLALAECGRGLLITEGIEDALTGHQRSGLSAWAAGTANRLPGLAGCLPAHIEAVTILVDADKAGRRFSAQLGDALLARDVEVRSGEIRQEVSIAA